MTITPGTLCLCRQAGKQLFVAVRQNERGRWLLEGKLVDQDGRYIVNGRSDVGIGDITLVRAAPAYARGETVEFGSRQLTVFRDLGHEVEFHVPEHSTPLKGGDAMRH